MDRSLPYNRMCGYVLDDEDPEEDLDEDGFTVQENEFLKEVHSKERGLPLFRDLSLADHAIVDGGMRLGLVEPTPCPRVGDPRPKDEDKNAHLKKGIKFGCFQEFKMWLSDYAIRNHRPFVVGHSNQEVRYTVKCDKQGWKLKVRGRKIHETGQWELKSHVATHECIPPHKADRRKGHRQLTSEYLGYKLLNEISHDPTVKVKFLMSIVEKMYGYKVNHGKVWKARQMLLGCCMVVMRPHTIFFRGYWEPLHIRTQACDMGLRTLTEYFIMPSGVLGNASRHLTIVVRCCL